jgi:hypothetical protein
MRIVIETEGPAAPALAVNPSSAAAPAADNAGDGGAGPGAGAATAGGDDPSGAQDVGGPAEWLLRAIGEAEASGGSDQASDGQAADAGAGPAA